MIQHDSNKQEYDESTLFSIPNSILFNTILVKEVKSSLSANGVTGGSKVSVEKLFRVKGD